MFQVFKSKYYNHGVLQVEDQTKGTNVLHLPGVYFFFILFSLPKLVGSTLPLSYAASLLAFLVHGGVSCVPAGASAIWEDPMISYTFCEVGQLG